MLPLLLSASGVNGVGVNSSCMTVELCAYIARNEGFAYFGVEAGTCAEGPERRLESNTSARWGGVVDTSSDFSIQ